MNRQQCKLLVEKGSSIDLLNETFVNKMKPTPKISKRDTKAYDYGQRQKSPKKKGKFTASVETAKKLITSILYIISGDYDSLLSYDASVQLELGPEINSITEKKIAPEKWTT